MHFLVLARRSAVLASILLVSAVAPASAALVDLAAPTTQIMQGYCVTELMPNFSLAATGNIPAMLAVAAWIKERWPDLDEQEVEVVVDVEKAIIDGESVIGVVTRLHVGRVHGLLFAGPLVTKHLHALITGRGVSRTGHSSSEKRHCRYH